MIAFLRELVSSMVRGYSVVDVANLFFNSEIASLCFNSIVFFSSLERAIYCTTCLAESGKLLTRFLNMMYSCVFSETGIKSSRKA